MFSILILNRIVEMQVKRVKIQFIHIIQIHQISASFFEYPSYLQYYLDNRVLGAVQNTNFIRF